MVRESGRSFVCAAVACLVVASLPAVSFSHCDTMDGPVVKDARIALDRGDLTPVLKWVKPEGEAEVRAALARTLAVRKLGGEAEDLADTWFFETLVRVHRAGEGAPYTGLKPAGTPLEPPVAAADRAIEAASADALVAMLTDAVADGIRERFARVIESARHAEESVEAGREFVEAYVIFIHYVERLHLDATTNPSGHGESEHPAAEAPHEHDIILLVLKGAERGAGSLAATLDADPDWLDTIVDFVRNFADRCHQSKEERHLFPRLQERGIPAEGGPIGVMLYEHEQGRAFIRAVAAAAEGARDRDTAALETAAQNLLGYVELLRSHIAKENGVLFPMADQALSDDDQRELAEAFERVEAEEMGEGVHERYHQLAHRLAGP
jgi:hemerythrin-like domain-containing protein